MRLDVRAIPERIRMHTFAVLSLFLSLALFLHYTRVRMHLDIHCTSRTSKKKKNKERKENTARLTSSCRLRRLFARARESQLVLRAAVFTQVRVLIKASRITHSASSYVD